MCIGYEGEDKKLNIEKQNVLKCLTTNRREPIPMREQGEPRLIGVTFVVLCTLDAK